MKKKNDLKKLAQMGMLAGMLLSSESAFANFGSDNIDNLAYLAAKCGAKCGGAVASSCGSSKCNAVAERSPYDRYGSRGGSCGSQGGYGYNNGCGSQHGSGFHSGCGAQQGFDYQTGGHSCSGYAQPSGHGCGASGSSQGYYDPSKWSNTPQGNQVQTQVNPGKQQATNNQNVQQQSGSQQGNQIQNNTGKYQASNGCGGSHGCNGGTTAGPNNGGKFQASNGCGGHAPSNNSGGSYYYNPNQVAEADTKVAPAKLNEADLLSKLNAQGKATYNDLTPEGKKLAIQLANAECKGKNECKGLNSCKTDKNACAGKGGCKAQSSCSFKDKNLAVKVAAAKMAEKRNGLQNKNGK